MLGEYKKIETEVMKAMLDLSGLKAGEVYIDLGSGDSHFVIEAEERGAIASGIEFNESLVNNGKTLGLNIIHGDIFDADVSKADVITFWFVGSDVIKLMDKLYAEMKPKARLIATSDNRKVYKNKIFIPEESGNTYLDSHRWQPSNKVELFGRLLYLYVR